MAPNFCDPFLGQDSPTRERRGTKCHQALLRSKQRSHSQPQAEPPEAMGTDERRSRKATRSQHPAAVRAKRQRLPGRGVLSPRPEQLEFGTLILDLFAA